MLSSSKLTPFILLVPLVVSFLGCLWSTSSSPEVIREGKYISLSYDTVNGNTETELTISKDTAYSVLFSKWFGCHISATRGDYTFQNGTFCYKTRWTQNPKNNECLTAETEWVRDSDIPFLLTPVALQMRIHPAACRPYWLVTLYPATYCCTYHT